MASRSHLPSGLLTEIGRAATIWAEIEQEILLQCSALSSLDHDGYTGDQFLRLEFKRLRERWYELKKKHVSAKRFDKEIHPLNTRLAELSEFRGYFIHAQWSRTPIKGKYGYSFWEQKHDGLTRRGAEVTLAALRAFNLRSQATFGRLRSAARIPYS